MVGGGQVDPLPGTRKEHLDNTITAGNTEKVLKLAVCQSSADSFGVSTVSQHLWVVCRQQTVVV